MIYAYTIRGIPRPQPRARAFSRGGKARLYDPGTAEAWKSDLARQMPPPATPLAGPLRVDIDFLLPRPKRLMRQRDPDGEMWHDAKPDRDNLDKAVLDALTALGWWLDDAIVCDGRIRKLYHAKTASPGARIYISLAGDPEFG
jgi:Holliday junction resolvase RusA-like endonuclease